MSRRVLRWFGFCNTGLRLAPAGDSDSDEESPSQGYLTSAFESLQQARRCVTSAERQVWHHMVKTIIFQRIT